ncbi:hypothetical protein G6F68_016649 [Rhizopus microsporus]|nr:hypothetical protein G6F68_016649 [Rhizopus microsporus]
MAFLNVPSSTSNALRVSSITTGRPASSAPCASQRASVCASTPGARPASGRMQLAERHAFAMAELDFQVGKARVRAQGLQEGVDALGGAGEKQVDALFGQQDGALERRVAGPGQQMGAQVGQGIQRNEFVGSDIEDGSTGKGKESGRRRP